MTDNDPSEAVLKKLKTIDKKLGKLKTIEEKIDYNRNQDILKEHKQMCFTYLALAVSYLAIALASCVYNDPIFKIIAILTIIVAFIFGFSTAYEIVKYRELDKKMKDKVSR